MDKIKLLIFVEFIALFVCVALHLYAKINNQEFPIQTYLIIAIIVLICCLLVIFLFAPLFELLKI